MEPPDPVYVFKGDMGPIHSLSFNIDQLYAGAETGKIHVWNLNTNRQVCYLEDDSGESCLSMHFMGNDLLLTQRKGGLVNFWNSQNSTWILDKTINTNYFGFCKSQKSSENSLFVPLAESKVGLLSVNTCSFEIEMDPSDNNPNLGFVMGIKPYQQSSNYVLVLYDAGQICLWDIRNLHILSTLEVYKSPMCIDFDPASRNGIVGSPSDTLQIFSLTTDHQLVEKKKLSIKNPGTSTVAIRPDKKLFATGGWDNRVRIYSWKSLKPLAVLNQHRGTIHDIVYSNCAVQAYNACKHLMAAAGKDGNISLWSIYNS